MDLIDEYYGWAVSASDAPETFHLAASYWVSSTVLGRHAYVLTTYNPRGIRPNLWTIIIGPSRIVRKTTVLNMAEDVVREVLGDGAFLPASFSPEALMESLSGLQKGESRAWVLDEMGGFFKSLQKRYMAGAREILSKLYSGRGETRKLRGQEFKIPHNLYVTAFGNLPTPASYYITDEDFTSGFMNRFIIVQAKTRTRHLPLLSSNPQVMDGRKKLVDELKQAADLLSKLSPVVVSFSATAQQALDDYDRQVEQELARLENENPYTLWKSYLAETPVFLLKMSVLRSLSSFSGESDLVVVGSGEVRKAFNDLRLFLSLAKEVVAEVETSARPKPVETERKQIEHVYHAIAAAGPKGVRFGRLSSSTGLTKQTLIPLIETLYEQGRVAILLSEPGPKGGRPGIILVASQHEKSAPEIYPRITPEKMRVVLRA